MDTIDIQKIDENSDYDLYMTGKDCKNIIQAVKNDSEIYNMRIMETHEDYSNGGGGGFSALFINDNTNEALVAFRGTSSGEWKDNFTGGGITKTQDGVSTQQQLNALEWYKDVYDRYDLNKYRVLVTGHSKGGNKAKYITVMDDSVDRCVSFDGQGFSDEFMQRYKTQIYNNQNKIENHNVCDDYVNILLNDIGNKEYYEGYDYGKGAFLENHCPNTFFDFKEDGKFTIRKKQQSEDMQIIDRFFNNCIRSLDDNDKADLMEYIGELAEAGFNSRSLDDIKTIFLDKNHKKDIVNLLTYTIRYEQEVPEFKDALRNVLKKLNMEEYVKILDCIDWILNSKYFNTIMDILNGVLIVTAIESKKLRELIKEKTGINLTDDEWIDFIEIVTKTNVKLDKIDIKADNGNDIKIPDKKLEDYLGKNTYMYVDLGIMKNVSAELADISKQIYCYSQELDKIKDELNLSISRNIKFDLLLQKTNIQKSSDNCKTLSVGLVEIINIYNNCEKKLVSII